MAQLPDGQEDEIGSDLLRFLRKPWLRPASKGRSSFHPAWRSAIARNRHSIIYARLNNLALSSVPTRFISNA